VSQPPRRIPNFKRFLITGGIVGLVVGIFLAYISDEAPGYDARTEVLYLAALGVFVGIGLFGLIAVLIDAWLRRRP
jgi:hypothetical protein